MTNKKKKDYEVGYCKPPKEYQYKKGNSGNPNGRPRGSKNINSYFEELKKAKIAIKEDGEVKLVPGGKALALAMMKKALKGDVRAATLVIDIIQKIEARQTETTVKPLTKSDQQILDEFLNGLSTGDEETTEEAGEQRETCDE